MNQPIILDAWQLVLLLIACVVGARWSMGGKHVARAKDKSAVKNDLTS